jgi:hypothetical protein
MRACLNCLHDWAAERIAVICGLAGSPSAGPVGWPILTVRSAIDVIDIGDRGPVMGLPSSPMNHIDGGAPPGPHGTQTMVAGA